ncbi:MAG: hypothetical protein HY657_03305 [Acidobacteria bacterium]|nr:hypothetical protein [Acidobacteriota bacterium]
MKLLFFSLGASTFVLLATANGAGYRYGVSDQALYIPVVVRALDGSAFPRDAALIDAQGRLMLVDEVLAGLVRASGLPLDALFLAGYVASLMLTWAALVLIGARVYHHGWATAALAAAFTMRHRIPRTSANSFEPYFHPRMLAFGLGALAVAALLRRRGWTAVALVAASAVVHVTTALWFAVLVGVALATLDARMRRLAVVAAGGALAGLVWAVAAGPLQAALTGMDDTWLQAVASKDSLFATAWPVWAWAANLAFLGLLWWAHRIRSRRGDATREDAALVWGATALVALFLATLPAVAAGLSLAVQFQISRVFWLVDFLATVYVIGVVADGRREGAAAPRLAVVTAALLVALSAARGAYIMLVERPERALFAVGIEQSPWEDAMRWVARQPRDVHLLADPGHAWKYGTSARVSAERDVLLEEVKDSALAIYSRDVAVRFVDRVSALGDFAALTADRAATLAARYDLDYLITEADLPLPLAYRNDRFRIYSLRQASP